MTVEDVIEILKENADSMNTVKQFSDYLKNYASQEDLPKIINELAITTDPWFRGSLAEAVIELDGPKYIKDLISAYNKNKKSGLDNDTFSFLLVEMVEMTPSLKDDLLLLKDEASPEELKTIEWLLGFCSD